MAVLAQDLTAPNPLHSYFALAPNTLASELLSAKRSPEFYYYSPAKDCLSVQAMNKMQAVLHVSPRDVEGFHEGLDNLSPVGQLREIIIAPLLSEGKSFGVLQFLNKKRGVAGDPDIEVARDLGELVGNYLGTAMGNLSLKMAVDRVADRFRMLRSEGALVGTGQPSS